MDLPPAPTPPLHGGGLGQNPDRTQNLLSLLKFSAPANASSHPLQSQQQQQSLSSAQHSQSREHQSDELDEPQLEPEPLEDEDDEEEHHEPQHRQSIHHLIQQPSLQAQNLFPTRLHQPAPSSADPSGLLAALMKGVHESEERTSLAPLQPAQPTNPFANSGSPSADTRSYLLNLLNRPKPSQTDQPLLIESSRANEITSPSTESLHQANRYLGPHHNHHQQQQPQQQPTSPYHAQQPYMPDSLSEMQRPVNANAFTYTKAQSIQEPADMSVIYQQLMGSLNQTSPHNNQNNSNQSAHGSAHGSIASPMHILQKDQSSPAGPFDHSRLAKDHSPLSNLTGQRHSADRASSLHSRHSQYSAHQSVQQSPPTSEYANFATLPETEEIVPETIHTHAPRADRDVQEASLERARHEVVTDFSESALKHENSEWVKSSADSSEVVHSLEKQIIDEIRADQDDPLHHYGSSDEPPSRKSEEISRDNNDDIHGVADNWESAEQDEVVVIEEKETPAVKVFNFPMKPWISITLREDATEPRPQFKDESIMDIARLKKEFDQIDRILYSASSTYMAYGMSKQGGLRVIRQDDGKDAKVFTDTKDRVFNVAMSVTPADHDGVPREAIIGTGISGTVYWVQIKDGEKDHIEDHLEQYGFALPPISSPDGDVPGGALKTRARASTTHPEYFAVNRGKSINFIWPSYILQKKLFKPGHDRVVDTEALLHHCSLKINTGKAGKDFTFSQDDTVVVSLDKSGRVKFWDVRDLTTAKEGTESLPLPAHWSLEVKEPLMTLASTPEGEKAWPTSVLLLDKQRPYQKRCALRYMIVGMKQNHTLQLWDLALGKPVQEFNLPHSKESDAVCSVMYHPASGMIIIGHPTRNSVYFAHLSAPKYNLKSVSQAEYIQRLVAHDPSIPQPDSTAVISGVREYSFANRGILRSLDILSNPAMNHDADEPTLFELYAMHSKGVACVLIRQAELGWSRENKVLEPVDAVEEGVVTVSKLKSPQQTEISQPSSAPEPAPLRIAQRTSTKELTTQPTSASSELTLRGPESLNTPIRIKNEPKELETPVQSSKENYGEKSERKRGKKKGKEGEVAANGATHKVEVLKAPISGMAAGSTSSDSFDSAIQGLEARLEASIAGTVQTSLNNLRGRIDESARVRDESFNQHQLKLLDMVSEVLNENTQKVLESLIHQQFTEVVIPSIGDKTGKAVAELLQHKLQPNIASSVQKEVQNSLPHALNRSLRSNEFVNAVTDRLASAVTTNLQQDVFATLTQRLTPTLTSIATQSAQRVASEVVQRYHEQFESLQAQHTADTHKIDQLLSYVSRLTDMVSTMAASQSSLQAEFLKLKQQPVELPGAHGIQPHHQTGSMAHSVTSHGYGNNVAGARGNYLPSQAPSQAASHSQPYVNSPQFLRGSQQVSSPHGSISASEHIAPVTNVSALASAYAHQMNKTQAEADHDLLKWIRGIEEAIQEGRLQEAMIQWFQSGREEEIFRRCLSRYPASKFEGLPPLVLLVVIATISKDLKPNSRLKDEVEWIEMAVRAFGANLPNFGMQQETLRDVTKSTLQTMQLLINRVQPLIASIHDGFPTDPFLANVDRGKLQWIVGTSQQILDTFTQGLH